MTGGGGGGKMGARAAAGGAHWRSEGERMRKPWLALFVLAGVFLSMAAALGTLVVCLILLAGHLAESITDDDDGPPAAARQQPDDDPPAADAPRPPRPNPAVRMPPGRRPFPPPLPASTNAVMNKFRGRATVTASSEWPSWPAALVADGKPATSWFSKEAGGNRDPQWVMVRFPVEVVVRRVVVAGNRDPQYPQGYSVASGRIELLDANGEVLFADSPAAAGASRDFDSTPDRPVDGVRAVRFTATADEGGRGGAGNVAIGEIMVE